MAERPNKTIKVGAFSRLAQILWGSGLSEFDLVGYPVGLYSNTLPSSQYGNIE